MRIKGRIVEVVQGATTAHVKLDVGGGTTITASITIEAVEELRLATGDAAYAAIKASEVMVGKGGAMARSREPSACGTAGGPAWD